MMTVQKISPSSLTVARDHFLLRSSCLVAAIIGFCSFEMKTQTDDKLEIARFKLPKQNRCTELQQMVLGRAGLYVIADFEAHSPTIIEPVVETSAIVDQVERSIAEGQRVSARDKGDGLSSPIELIEHTGRKESEACVKPTLG